MKSSQPQAALGSISTKANPRARKSYSTKDHYRVGRLRWSWLCGSLVALLYLVKGTVIPSTFGISNNAWDLISCVALLVGAGTAIASVEKYRWSWAVVVLAFSMSLTTAKQPILCACRCTGLTLLIISVGPFILGPKASAMRLAAWRLSTSGMVAFTGMFFFWYVFRLPSLGKGPFSGFMTHCMLLGPIAGMGVAIACAYALNLRSWFWAIFAALGVLPVLASWSRVAFLATIVAICFLLIRHNPWLALIFLALFLWGISEFIHQSHNILLDDTSIIGSLVEKGTENTREDLWHNRILDFKSSPLVGIGIGNGMGAGSGEDDDPDNIHVEPGSCYLAVLSMTGVVGASALSFAVVSLIVRCRGSRKKSQLDRDILSVVGVYLSVQGSAEGWILSFGSPICFLFWLWLGNLEDTTLQTLPGINCSKTRLSNFENQHTQPSRQSTRKTNTAFFRQEFR